MTPFERSRAELPKDIRKALEESNLPIEVATAIADVCEQRTEVGTPSKSQDGLRDKILAERDKGNLVYAHIEGYSVVSVEDFVKQPVDGMLYDLNRGEEVSLSFITDQKWVNDFAVALVIRKLVEQRDSRLGVTI